MVRIEEIYQHTATGNWLLRVELEDYDGSARYADYEAFSVSDSSDKYRLSVGDYSGNATNSMNYNNNVQFSTKDHGPVSWCADDRKGGWWFLRCTNANLNGLYGATDSSKQAMYWFHWKGWEGMKTSLMKMRQIN